MKIKKKHHPWLIAGGVVAGVGLIVYLYEKNKTPAAAPAATNVQGQTLPTGNGPALPNSAGTVVSPSSVVAPGG